MRKILVGEENLTKFLAAWANVDLRAEGVECRIDAPDKLFKGQIKELQAITKSLSENSIILLMGINVTDKGNFVDFYKDFFGRPSVKDYSSWQRALKDPDNGLTATRYQTFDIQDSLEFRKFDTSA